MGSKLYIGNGQATPSVVKIIEVTPKYSLLNRVKDDNNNDIGCVIGYHVDVNNQKYAVVLLRTLESSSINATYVISDATSIPVIPNLPTFNRLDDFSQKETAKFSCDKILDFALANNLTTPAIDACRNMSFVIDGITYYGQLPLIRYITMLFVYRNEINLMYPNNIQIKVDTSVSYAQTWSCTQKQAGQFLQGESSGNILPNWGSNNARVFPVLEIPIE